MQCVLSGRFNISFDSGASSSYLIFEALQDEKVLEYQAEMIAANRIPFILPLDLNRTNGKVSFCCNITSKLSFSYYLKHRKLPREDFLAMLHSIATAVLDSRRYFLDGRAFVLDCDYIYVNPSTLEISFAYLPVEVERDINADLKELLIYVILYLADLEDCESDNYLQRILGCLKSETFSVAGLDSLLISLMGKVHAPAIKGNAPAIKSNTPAIKSNAPPRNACDSPKKPVLGLASKTVLSQIALLAAVFTAFRFVAATGDASLPSYGAVILIAASADVLLLKAFLTQRSGGTAQQRAGSDAAGGAFGLSIPAAQPEAARLAPGRRTGSGQGAAARGGRTGAGASSKDERDRKAEDTEVLVPGNITVPVLRSTREDGEEILITKQDFIIGRLAGEVDYTTDNRAVGKIHARVSLNEEGCTITDLNSRNGTFINGKRLVGNQDYPLKNKDIVTFANSDYIFLSGNDSLSESRDRQDI